MSRARTIRLKTSRSVIALVCSFPHLQAREKWLCDAAYFGDLPRQPTTEVDHLPFRRIIVASRYGRQLDLNPLKPSELAINFRQFFHLSSLGRCAPDEKRGAGLLFEPIPRVATQSETGLPQLAMRLLKSAS